MRQPRWLGVFGVAALMLAAGCEDPPLVVSTLSMSPSPGASGSPSPAPSGSLSPSSSPSPSPSGTVSPAPTPSRLVGPTPNLNQGHVSPTPVVTPSTATPTPVASASASPSPSPSPSPALSVVIDKPTTNTEFGAPFDVAFHAVAGLGVLLQTVQLLFDGRVIDSVDSADGTYAATAFDPYQTDNLGTTTDATPVAHGSHTLRGRVITLDGVSVDSPDFSFVTPLRFAGWTSAVPSNLGNLTLPSLPVPRTDMALYGTRGYLFGFFGETAQGTPAPTVLALSLGLASPSWTVHDAPGLAWRQNPAVAGTGDTVYVVGGQPTVQPTQSTLAAPTAHVDAFDLFNHAVTSLPDLPAGLTQASATVNNNFLYVVGGSTTGLAADASASVYRLALSADGTPQANAAWQTRASLPAAMRGLATVSAGGKLYALGGQATDGTRRESILAYDETADSWQRVQLLPAAISNGAAVELGGSVFYLGGYAGDGSANRNTIRFDYQDTAHGMPVRAFADDKTNLPTGRARLGATVMNDPDQGTRLFIAGGENLSPTGTITPLGEVFRADTL